MKHLKCCIAFLLCSLAATVPSRAGEAKERVIAGYHLKPGIHVICFDCHQEERPTKKAVASESCMVCHGDYPAMRALTKNVKPNPHNSHMGEVPCTECHRGHQPSRVICLECHEGEYKFNIPVHTQKP
jgi:cytochrome c peroxidase